ncbi:hypothetical protein, partial [Pseudomonas hunanensis]
CSRYLPMCSPTSSAARHHNHLLTLSANGIAMVSGADIAKIVAALMSVHGCSPDDETGPSYSQRQHYKARCDADRPVEPPTDCRKDHAGEHRQQA